MGYLDGDPYSRDDYESINALGEPDRGAVIAEAHRLHDTIVDKSGTSEDAA